MSERVIKVNINVKKILILCIIFFCVIISYKIVSLNKEIKKNMLIKLDYI